MRQIISKALPYVIKPPVFRRNPILSHVWPKRAPTLPPLLYLVLLRHRPSLALGPCYSLDAGQPVASGFGPVVVVNDQTVADDGVRAGQRQVRVGP